MTTSEKADQDRREALREARVQAFFARQKGELARGEAAGARLCKTQLQGRQVKARQVELFFGDLRA